MTAVIKAKVERARRLGLQPMLLIALAAQYTPVLVAAGATETLDFNVTPGEPAFRITRIRPPTRESDFFNAINAANPCPFGGHSHTRTPRYVVLMGSSHVET